MKILFLLVGIFAISCHACDSLVALPVATGEKSALIYGKNADRSSSEVQPIYMELRQKHDSGSTLKLPSGLVIPQVEETYATVGSRPYWGWGYSMGVNEYGVAIGNEMFPCKSRHVSKEKLPEFMDLDRLVLERAKTAAEAITVLTDMITKYGQGPCEDCPSPASYNNLFMVTDTKDAYIVMAVEHEWAYRQVTSSISTISNHYFLNSTHTSPTAQATAKANGWWNGSGHFDFGEAYGTSSSSSARRQQRSSHMLNNALKHHPIAQADMMLVLSDHSDGENPDEPYVGKIKMSGTMIDHHGKGEITASSLITDFPADPKTREPIVWHALTNPCESFYYPVFFGVDRKAVPAWMLSKDPWRSFKHVAYGLAGEDMTKVQKVRDIWKPLQKQVFADAYEVATRSKERGGDVKLLAEFMTNTSNLMFNTLRKLNSTVL